MINASTGNPEEVAAISLNQKIIYLKAECDFTNKKDLAHFYFSLDSNHWTELGTPLKMTYTIPQFMGYRFTLFNYATKETGGYADFDYFHIVDSVSASKFR